MKKIIYLFTVIFLVSLISSAKKIQGSCASVCKPVETKKCEPQEKQATKQGEHHTPSLSLFFFNI
jgi:hypothetical protein